MWVLVRVTGELVGAAVALIAGGMAGWAVLIKAVNWARIQVLESDLERARAEREIKLQDLEEEYEIEQRRLEMWKEREERREKRER